MILQLLTRSSGRVSCIAKGVLRKGSKLSGVLEPVCLLQIETKGKSSLQTLTNAEVSYRHPELVKDRLFALFYMNELIVKLTVENDSLANLFEHYSRSIESLSEEEDIEPVLRAFEVSLLNELGFGLNLTSDCESGKRITAESYYVYDLESGAKKISMASETLAIKGSTLLALAGRRRYQVEEAREAKQLMRRVIQRHLGDRKIESRELFRGSSHRLDV
jgi:DNA repair protein RecO (recombination protein O)